MHGLTIAIGILVGGVVAARDAQRRGLDPEPLYTVDVIVVAAALVGGRVYYLGRRQVVRSERGT